MVNSIGLYYYSIGLGIYYAQTNKQLASCNNMQNKMESTLASAKEITSLEYLTLKNPIFIGQTRLDENQQYWMVFEDNGILYKINNTL